VAAFLTDYRQSVNFGETGRTEEKIDSVLFTRATFFTPQVQ
jgi:hypothetical protein